MSYYSTEIERLSENCEKNRKIGWGSDQSEGPKSKLGRTTMMVLAVTLHNIPEGIAASVPIYQATGKKRKAFWLSFLSGLSEPVGAVIGYFVLLPFWSSTVEGALMALTAGIMVYISLDELLPTAREYGKHHIAIGGLIAGMAVMSVSLLLFA